MHRVLISAKTTGAGLVGAFSSATGIVVNNAIDWLSSDDLHKAMGNVLLILFCISSMVAIVSGCVRVAINWHKNKKYAIEEALASFGLCIDCSEGKIPPRKCPYPMNHRPINCPHITEETLIARLKKHVPKPIDEETSSVI